jgi:LmbE family N-acetylglucosaminyl deacetylase
MTRTGAGCRCDWRDALDSSTPLAIVVAHPDDEVIGVGGQLARWTAHRPVTVVSVTDGAPLDDRDSTRAGFTTRAEYAAARRRELQDALACCPKPPRVVHLEATDQRVTHDLESILRCVRDCLESLRPAVVVTHAYEGGHPDHDALALAVSVIAHRSANPFLHVEFAEYSENAVGRLRTNDFPFDHPGRSIRVSLTDAERRLKATSLRCFRTQQETLRSFGCDKEALRPAPAYDFGSLPNNGRVWYDRFQWGLTSAEWLTYASRPLLCSGLC